MCVYIDMYVFIYARTFSIMMTVVEGPLTAKKRTVHTKGGANGLLLSTWSQWLPRFHIAPSFIRGARGFHFYTQ